jgi:hypothetical protein
MGSIAGARGRRGTVSCCAGATGLRLRPRGSGFFRAESLIHATLRPTLCPCIQFVQMVKSFPKTHKPKMCQYTSGRTPGYRYSSTGAIAKMLSRDSGRERYFPVTQRRTINKNSPAKTSKASAASAAAAKSIHVGVTCDHCFEQNIAGVRHRCSECFDFDMCDACFAKH